MLLCSSNIFNMLLCYFAEYVSAYGLVPIQAFIEAFLPMAAFGIKD